jgi:hypothetical protein
MNTKILSALAASVLAGFPVVVAAKANLSKIVVRSEGLSTPLEITDPSVLRSFTIWYGPGVRMNSEPNYLDPEKPGPTFIDWIRKGSTERPGGLVRHEVVFVMERPGVRAEYVVQYEFKPGAEGGYIYLPGRGDPHGPENVRLIFHGVEGQWFHSSALWEKLVRPRVVASSAH